MVDVGSVEIGNVIERTGVRHVADAPEDDGDGRLDTDQLNLRRAEEGYGEVAGQVEARDRLADTDGEGFHQILAAVAVVQSAGAEKQGDRHIDRGLLPAVPGNAQASARERGC